MSERFDVHEFLEEYQRFPCLWNKKCVDFKNRLKRDQAEQVLLPVTGLTTIKELRRKIRNIRCTYNQEVAKIKKSMRTATGPEDVFTPKLVWFAFADSFLRQNMEENDSESNSVSFYATLLVVIINYEPKITLQRYKQFLQLVYFNSLLPKFS